MARAVIFDMDGVISDTQTIHSRIESGILSRFGIALSPEEITKRYAGTIDMLMFRELFNRTGLGQDPKLAAEEKWQEMEKEVSRGVQEIPGSVSLVRDLVAASFSLGIASSSPLHFIEKVLETLHLSEFFGARASSEEVAQGKPAPDVFLLCAERLGVLPQECMVIEDGVAGMEGAKKAGMKCIGLVPDRNQTGYPADFLVERLGELSPEFISSLSW